MKTLIKIMAAGLLFTAGSCKRDVLRNPQGYIADIGNNKDLKRTVVMNGIRYDFQVLPPEAIALKYAMDSSGKVDAAKYREKMNAVHDFVFVNINEELEGSHQSLLKSNIHGQADYDHRIMYYEFYAGNDVTLQQGDYSCRPVSYQFENHQDLVPYNTLVMAFPKISAPDASWSVVFNDKAFNNLMIKATFHQKDIEKVIQ